MLSEIVVWRDAVIFICLIFLELEWDSGICELF